MSDSLTIDSVGPLPIRRSASVAEIGGWIRDARAANHGVFPFGGRTLLDLGCKPSKTGFAIDTTALNNVIDYPARDMTITVQAGVTISQLQATLAKEGQWLPIDVPHPDRATIGGAIATNASGAHRWGHGTLRDYVIGISFLTDDGVEVKGGGRVVKNVAGYDFMKLQTGALGTLGLITQVTLKVKPKPEAAIAVAFGVSSSQLASTLDLLHNSKSRPVAVELLNSPAAQAIAISSRSEWTLLVGFAEKRTTAEWQRTTLIEELKSADVREIPAPWPAVTALQTRSESRFIWKANVLPSRTAAFVNDLGAATDDLLHAQPLNGIVWIHADSDRKPESAASHGGALVTRRAPSEWKTFNRVWGTHPRGDFALMQHLKRTLDPQNVFNPGRVFGG